MRRLNFADKLRTIFRESITSVDCAQNIVVFKTHAGSGRRRLPRRWISMDVTDMVGTLAGDDTGLRGHAGQRRAETSARRSGKCCKRSG